MYKQCETEQSAARQRRMEQGLLEMMGQKRYEDISVSDLCAFLGVPRKTFYRYFSGKDGALFSLIDHVFAGFQSFMDPAASPGQGNQLAEMENYNVTYYNDWFKQQTGVSPSLYLRHTRIERAKELLVDTEFTVMEIAVMVGYSSNATFTRAFHSITGMTPKAYRESPAVRQKLG